MTKCASWKCAAWIYENHISVLQSSAQISLWIKTQQRKMEVLMKSKEQSKAELREAYKILKVNQSCILSHTQKNTNFKMVTVLPELKLDAKILTYSFENIFHYVSISLGNSSLAKSLFYCSFSAVTAQLSWGVYWESDL